MNERLLWITKQRYRCSQDLPSALTPMDNIFSELGSFKSSCYLSISGNFYKIIITWLTFRGCHDSSENLLFFKLLDVCFRGNKKALCTVSAWISSFINNLICIRFIPLWMNVIQKKLYEPATIKSKYFPILL